MTKLLEGAVAQILNERELVITLGRSSGVKIGMTFAVMADEHPIEIRDPFTDEVLGREDREKVRVRVIRVEQKYSVCQTLSYRTRGGPFSEMLGNNYLFARPELIHTTLNARKEEYPAPLDPEESYVQVKDRVKHIPEVRLPERAEDTPILE